MNLRPTYYVLDGKKTRPVDDVLQWARAFEDAAARRVAETHIGNVRVSTVFLGMDHNWTGGRPLIFETMIFGGPHDDYQERYSTWEEAEEGHKAAVELASQTCDAPEAKE